MPRLTFSERESIAEKAIAVSFDLGGFSRFCNQPDAPVAAPRLMKHTFDLLNRFLHDQGESNSDRLPEPNLIKFSGDGALMLWLLRSDRHDFSQEFCDLVVRSMRRFQMELHRQLCAWEMEWRLNNLPKHVRVGIATGVVYAMRPPHTIRALTDPQDYVGYCINLAVRLQDYFPDLGFLVHGVLHPKIEGMETYVATKLKGAQREPVAVFYEDVQRVDRENRSGFQSKFAPLDID